MPSNFGMVWEYDPVDEAALRRRLSDRRTRLGPMCTVAADPVMAFIGHYGMEVAERAKARAPVDTGRLKASIVFRWDQDSGRVYSTAPYAGFVDQGTRPHWPPVRALEGWARRHGIPAFLVARSIAEWGTEATHFISGALADTERSLPRLLQDTATRITMSWNAGV